MRHKWSYYVFFSCSILDFFLLAQGFLQTSLQQSRTRFIGTSWNPLRVGRALTGPHFCSVPTKASVDVTPVPAAAQQAGGGEDGDLLLFPFRHKNTVFIEMTDMYGIVYHANYLTYALRAIEHAFGAPAARVHRLHDMKYRAAATVGEKLLVEGSLVAVDSWSSRWRFQITAAADPSRVFVSAEITLSWLGATGVLPLPPGRSAPLSAGSGPGEKTGTSSAADTRLLQPLPDDFVQSPKSIDVVVWNDDLEKGEGSGKGALSIRALLNYFERIRTLSLGRGPDGELGLSRLHREGVSVVVTSIVDLRLDSEGVVAGDTLEVRLGTKLTRGNKFMTMYETLWTKDDTLIAHAEVALLCMDNETRKFQSVPPWVREIMTVPLAAIAE